MADIFLSYKREDRERVRPLVEALQARGWSVWWDTRIGVGETWDRVIEAELAAAKCVVVVWSRLSVESRWVRSEAHEGLERNCLIPVIIDRTKPPLAFKLIQTTDLAHWRGDTADRAFADICGGVQRIVENGDLHGAVAEVLQPNQLRRIEIDLTAAMVDTDLGNAQTARRDYDRGAADFNRAVEIGPKKEQPVGAKALKADNRRSLKRAKPDVAAAKVGRSTHRTDYRGTGLTYDDASPDLVIKRVVTDQRGKIGDRMAQLARIVAETKGKGISVADASAKLDGTPSPEHGSTESVRSLIRYHAAPLRCRIELWRGDKRITTLIGSDPG